MNLEELRIQMDAINREIIELFAKRLKVAIEIAKIKKVENLPVYDPVREEKQKAMLREIAEKTGISPEVIDEIFTLLVEYSKMKMEEAR